MPNRINPNEFFSIKNTFQLIAATLFTGLGLYIVFSTFKNNYILIGRTKNLFGFILIFYGIVKVIRVYNDWKKFKKNSDEGSFK